MGQADNGNSNNGNRELEKLFSRITLPADVIRKKEEMKADILKEIHGKMALQKRRATLRPITLYLITSAACILFFIISGLVYDHKKQSEEKDRLLSFLTVEVPQDVSDDIYVITENQKEVVQQEETLVHTHTGQLRGVHQGKVILEDDPSEFITLIVPKGKRTTLVLSDGTTVWVNSGTRLVYPKTFNGKYRDISVDGEIFLDVTANRQQPFRVFSETFKVEVLGTQFNFNSYDVNNAHVVLVEGSVKVKSDYQTCTLVPNEGLFIREGEAFKQTVDPEMFVSWKDGKMKFDDELLSDIVKRLANYYGVQIELNELSRNMRMSGSINLRESIQDILDAFATSMSLRITVKENVIYIE